MEKQCPMCSERLVDGFPPRPGRPREYCSKACRRHAEQRRLREREAKRRADIVTTLDADSRCLRDMALDSEEFERRLKGAGLLKGGLSEMVAEAIVEQEPDVADGLINAIEEKGLAFQLEDEGKRVVFKTGDGTAFLRVTLEIVPVARCDDTQH